MTFTEDIPCHLESFSELKTDEKSKISELMERVIETTLENFVAALQKSENSSYFYDEGDCLGKLFSLKSSYLYIITKAASRALKTVSEYTHYKTNEKIEALVTEIYELCLGYNGKPIRRAFNFILDTVEAII